MGHRANYVRVLEDGTFDVTYSHWGAQTLDSELFWGPEYLDHLWHPEAARDHWYGDEGGCLFDPVRRWLWWFGGWNLRFGCRGIRERQLHLQLMQVLWPGWTVEWGHTGENGLRSHCGLPPHDQTEVFSTFQEALSRALGPGCGVLTVEDGLVVHDVAAPRSMLRHLANADPSLVDTLVAWSRTAARLRETPLVDARFGIHLAPDSRTLRIWADEVNWDHQRLCEEWSGWKIDFHGHDLDAHFEWSRGAYRPPTIAQATLIERRRRAMLEDEPNDGEHVMQSIGQAFHASGRPVVGVTSSATRSSPPRPVIDRAALFERAIAGLLGL